jgi:hypothetical protein
MATSGLTVIVAFKIHVAWSLLHSQRFERRTSILKRPTLQTFVRSSDFLQSKFSVTTKWEAVLTIMSSPASNRLSVAIRIKELLNATFVSHRV